MKIKIARKITCITKIFVLVLLLRHLEKNREYGMVAKIIIIRGMSKVGIVNEKATPMPMR